MTRSEPGDLVAVRFPHIERRATVRRPALVLARCETDAIGVLLWTLMVTNVDRPGWAGDIAIPDAKALGLVIPSKVRTAKISSVEEAAVTPIGRLDDHTWQRVLATVKAAMRTVDRDGRIMY